VNSKLHVEDSRVPGLSTASSRSVTLPRDRSNTATRRPACLQTIERKSNRAFLPPVEPPVPAITITRPEPRKAAPPESQPVRFNFRRLLFRSVRLALASALVATAVVYTRTHFATAKSSEAYINAEITALRAPIAGEVRMELIPAGRMLPAGAALFTIENSRFGNEQAASTLNWVTELAQRLRAEADEATVRVNQQREIFKVYEKMFAEQVIPRLELLEEQTKLAVAATLMTNKLDLARKTEERAEELSRQARLQQNAVVTMPFDGVPWSASVKAGERVAIHQTVLEVINPERLWVDAFFHERHSEKLMIGARVNIRSPKGAWIGRGTVESVRGGIGRIPFDGVAASTQDEYAHRRIAARVRLETNLPFDASQYYGLGRNVVVTTAMQ
jgi:multidrug resistance efflux pump